MTLGTVNAADGFAMAMVVILTLSLGVVAMLLYSISRSGIRREQEVENLLEEVEREEKAAKKATPSAGKETREAWEKDGDWWKT